jgi:5-methylcytosine-specific restriction endonuclease McrA
VSRPSGPRWQRLVAAVLQHKGRVCWLCGHEGADTADHVIPYDTRPDLAWSWDNLKPAHGARRTVASHGYECIGNYGRGKNPVPSKRTRSRRW